MLKELRIDDEAMWKQRIRTPIVLTTKLAIANPVRGLAISNQLSDAFQLCAWDVPTGELRQLTNYPEGKRDGQISPNGSHIYYVDDQQGNEIGHYVRFPFEGGKPQDVTPDMPPYSSFDPAFSWTGNLMGFIMSDSEGSRVYCIDLRPDNTLGIPQLLHQSQRLIYGPVLSHNGEFVVIASTEHTDKLRFRLIAIDTTNGQQVGELWDGAESSMEVVAFSPLSGDFRLLATTNQSGFTRPLIWNPVTGERADLSLDELDGEVVALNWSPDGKCVLLCHFNRAAQQLCIYNLHSNELKRLNHPSGTYGFHGKTYYGSDLEIFAQWQNSTHPPRLIALDVETGAQTRTVLTVSDAPPGHPWRSVSFNSSDGQEIQGWLGLPNGEGPFPMILEMHGGPTDVETETAHPLSQAFLDHGFAYLTINYRGSTTFGREFQEKILGDIGHWEMEDMVAARDWLVAQGIARPDSVLLHGGSYGGYLTLLGLGMHPDLWAGGIAGIPLADWAMVYEDASGSLRAYDVELFGGTPEDKPEQYAVSSPITYAENVKAPVFILHGRNDTRCPARQVEIYEATLKALGKDIELHWFDAGHGTGNLEQIIEFVELMLKFAYRVFKGG